LFTCCGPPRLLASFPTRRSSDLRSRRAAPHPASRDKAADIQQGRPLSRRLRRGGKGDAQGVGALDQFLHIAEHVIDLELVLAERSEEHTSELQSRENLVCRLLLE